jgi:6-phosphogluconolactonase
VSAASFISLHVEEGRAPMGGLALTILLALFALAGCAARAPAACDPGTLAYVGTESGKIVGLRLDACTGKLATLGEVAQVPKPRWIASHPGLPVTYAATDGDGKEGSVVAFRRDASNGALTRLNEAGTGGAGATHLWLDTASMTLLAANFGGGSTSSLAINADGSLGAKVSTIKATGSGPHRRQSSPHAHGVAVDPSGRYALVADMGADRVFVHGFDRGSRSLRADEGRTFVSPPGSGPRHLVFDPAGRFVYLLNELTAELMALRWDANEGHLALMQTLATSTPEVKADSRSASEIAISRDGRFVYATNRGDNAFVVYRVGNSGELTFVQRLATGGQAPWGFDIHPSGRWLLVINYRSNHVRLFAIEPGTGTVSDTGQLLEIARPWCVAFVNY